MDKITTFDPRKFRSQAFDFWADTAVREEKESEEKESVKRESVERNERRSKCAKR